MTRTTLASLGVALVLGCLAPAQAQDAQSSKKILDLIDQFADRELAGHAVEVLKEFGPDAIPHLKGEAMEGGDMVRRGWSCVALAEIGGEKARIALEGIYTNTKQSKLVRTWAAAARVKLAKSAAELSQLSNLAL